MITQRDVDVLRSLARYFVLNRPQIQRLNFPEDTAGRITRRRLQALVMEHLINRHNLVFHHPQAGSPGPVYYPSRAGCEFLAEHFDDQSYLLTPTQTPQPHHAFHWLAVSETHMALDQAIAAQSDVHLEGWLSEWDVANKSESAPEKHYRIYTLISETPRLVCVPDAAFLLSLDGHKKVFYLEQDRDTSGVQRISASKTPGYAAMAERKLHRRHFPSTTIDAFSVLMIAPTARRRDALRKAIKDKPAAAVWKFACVQDITPENFLHAPVFYPCDGEAVPLVKKQGDVHPGIGS